MDDFVNHQPLQVKITELFCSASKVALTTEKCGK